jgi:molecular chaperone GrpE
MKKSQKKPEKEIHENEIKDETMNIGDNNNDESVKKNEDDLREETLKEEIENKTEEIPEETDPLQLLIDQVSLIEEQKKEAEEKFVRLVAEFDNYKKRIARDFERQSDMIREKIFLSILPVMDDLDRLLQHEENNGDISLDGIKLIKNNFIKILEGHGVKPFIAKGEPFDPDKHDAMLTQKSEDHETPTVLDEFEKGYMIHDKVLRHARVIVSTAE